MGTQNPRLLVYVLLVLAAVASVALGSLTLALVLTGLKAALVGGQYMELRHSHAAHFAGFLAWVVLLASALTLALLP